MLISDPPFWRAEPFAPAEFELIKRLFVAHSEAARHSNASTGAVINSYHGSRNYLAAIASGLLAFGDVHGPVLPVRHLLEHDDPSSQAASMLADGKRVPGWGSAFAGTEAWESVFTQIAEMHLLIADRITAVTRVLAEAGKPISPNPACATAAVAIILGVPAPATMFLLVSCRLPTWSALISSEGESWA
jgi:citrate synthase